jgi:hypothetical protein
MIKIGRLIVVATVLASSGAVAGEGFWDQYFIRSDSITADAGDAKEVNAATHIIDPWSRYSRHRRIPADAARMTGAIQRYRTNAGQAGRQDTQVGQPGTGATPGSTTSTPLGGAMQPITPQ